MNVDLLIGNPTNAFSTSRGRSHSAPNQKFIQRTRRFRDRAKIQDFGHVIGFQAREERKKKEKWGEKERKE